MIEFRRMGALGAAGMVAMVVGGVACGGGGGGGGAGSGGAVPGTPAAQCMSFVSTYCERSLACSPDAGAGATKEMCVSSLNVAFGCERAATAFDDCLKDVKAVSCTSLQSALPGSCETEINKIPLSAAQMKCDQLGGVFCQWLAMCDGITPTATQLQNCQLAFFSDFDCFFATAVSDQCIADLPKAPCDSPDGGADGGGMGAATPSCDDPITYVN